MNERCLSPQALLLLGVASNLLGCASPASTVDAGAVPDGGDAPPDAALDAAADAAPTANLLFASSFGPGVSLSPPYGFSGVVAWQDLVGTDVETGFTFPIRNAPDALLDANFFGMQLIAPVPIDASTVGNHIVNQIREGTGPDGSPVHSLFQNVITGSSWAAQSPFLINRGWHDGDVTDLYISFWYRLPDNAASQLYLPDGNSRILFEFKTGGYENDWPGDYRISTGVLIGADDELYWVTRGDNRGNIPTTVYPQREYWRDPNYDIPVPIGEWFFYEIYWHRSGGNDGRFWSAVNGQVIVDHAGPNLGVDSLPITRIMITNAYSGGHAPVQQDLTRLEIWDGFPCEVGTSCYSR